MISIKSFVKNYLQEQEVIEKDDFIITAEEACSKAKQIIAQKSKNKEITDKEQIKTMIEETLLNIKHNAEVGLFTLQHSFDVRYTIDKVLDATAKFLSKLNYSVAVFEKEKKNSRGISSKIYTLFIDWHKNNDLFLAECFKIRNNGFQGKLYGKDFE